MMHKAWCSKEEVPYCFPRPSIKFQGHKGQKIDDLDQIWARLLGRSQLSNPSDLPCLVWNTFLYKVLFTTLSRPFLIDVVFRLLITRVSTTSWKLAVLNNWGTWIYLRIVTELSRNISYIRHFCLFYLLGTNHRNRRFKFCIKNIVWRREKWQS